MEFIQGREREYRRMRVPDRSWEDAFLCFLDGEELREVPLEIEPPDPEWPFEVSRRVVREELIAGVDRTIR